MAGQTSYTEIYGTLIDSWAGSLLEPFKQVTPILDAAKFSEGKEQGGTFHWPMRGTVESGTTFAAARATPGESGTAYVGARSGQAPDWQVEAPQIHGRSRVTYEALARSMDSVDANAPDKKKAVRDASSFVIEGLMSGTVKKAEALMLHGRRGLGQFEAYSSVVAASTVAGNELANPFDANAAGYIIDVQISAATWAEAIFIQSEGGTFDLWSNASGLPSAKLNTASNTVLTSGTNQTGCVLTCINPPTPQSGLSATATRVLRLFHSSGTLGGAGVGVIGGATFNSLASGHIVYESGGTATEYVSLTSMARNTGTLLGVSGVTYSIAKGNFEDSVGNLKLGDLIRKLSRPINKGAAGKRIRAVVPTELFAQFANDESTLRRYPVATPDAKNGFESIEMYLPHGSVLEILGHNLQKEGEVLCYPTDEVIRVGAQDFELIKRGRDKNAFILEVAQSPTSEARAYGQFAPLAQAPSHMLHLSGVTF
ncbi:MAG: hypothetical protein IPQ23_22480 [Cytophagaceae bacterium]|nr:hypothetical protein [Cytophagaceae bacterium]